LTDFFTVAEQGKPPPIIVPP